MNRLSGYLTLDILFLLQLQYMWSTYNHNGVHFSCSYANVYMICPGELKCVTINMPFSPAESCQLPNRNKLGMPPKELTHCVSLSMSENSVEHHN